MTRRLLVIGGDAAGMSAASQARRRRDVDALEIVAFERGNHVSYSACGIPSFVASEVATSDELIARDISEFRDGLDIDVRIRHEVVEIDVSRRAVHVRALDDATERWEPFDELVVATGAVPVRPSLPEFDASDVFGLQVLDDGIALRRAIDTGSPRRAVVVGGGYIGLEIAEALVMRGLSVTLVDAGAQPMHTLDPDMGALVADALRAAGVTVHLDERVEAIDHPSGNGLTVITTARTVPADLVVCGLGTRPNSGLAARAGVPVGVTGGVVTDARMHTAIEGVWAAGDCVETRHRVSGRAVAIALGTHANKQGRVAGINIGGGSASFPGVIGTAITKICGVEIARTGLNEAQAADAGFEFVSVAIDSTTKAGYFPGAAPIRLKMIADAKDGRVLGAQIVGGDGAAMRIDAIAVAIWSGMTVDELSSLDLAYAPPFAPVWDPILIAARKGAEAVAGRQAVS
ncbi:MAG: FAD-dependent oxidoreductase [Acidimicrobiia bacterium]